MNMPENPSGEIPEKIENAVTRLVPRELPLPRQWEPLSFVPMLAGLYWLLAHSGGGWLIWALVPGGLLFVTGTAQLLMPGETRVAALMAMGAFLGILAAPLVWIASDLGTAFLTSLVSILSFMAAGRLGLKREPHYEGAPTVEMNAVMDAKAALDEAVIGYFLASADIPSGEKAAQNCRNAIELEKALTDNGYIANPESLHPAPSPPEKTWFESGRLYGYDYDILRFDSGYQPPASLPGGAQWNSYRANRTCSVRVMRHPGPPRPWLMCVHGYRMGVPWMDLSLFSPAWLHEQLGLNLLMPILPLHGPRREGLRSGDSFLDGDIADLVYAESQSLWDLRRTLAWLRREEPEAKVGVLGFSLGGYNTALLAGYDANLEFAIAGIPAVDLTDLLWRHLPRDYKRYFASQGVTDQRYRHMLTPVSPLAQPPLLPKEKLSIFAGAGDRLVIPSQPLMLARHWGVPINWFQGAHLTVRNEPQTRDSVKEALLRAGWSKR